MTLYGLSLRIQQIFLSYEPEIINEFQIGCPRLAKNSGKPSDFLQAYKNAYYTQHIKKQEFVRHRLAIKFLHGRVL